MEKEQIQALLQRYMEGATTADEEEQLRHYFNAGPYDEAFAQYAPLFAAWDAPETPLTPDECDEILACCPPPSRAAFVLRTAWRYAAVWLIGLILGGCGVWLTYGSAPTSTKPTPMAAAGERIADTIYRERVIMERDTVYVVRYQKVSVQPTSAKDVAQNANESTRPETTDTQSETSDTWTDVAWEQTGNVAGLAVR